MSSHVIHNHTNLIQTDFTFQRTRQFSSKLVISQCTVSNFKDNACFHKNDEVLVLETIFKNEWNAGYNHKTHQPQDYAVLSIIPVIRDSDQNDESNYEKWDAENYHEINQSVTVSTHRFHTKTSVKTVFTMPQLFRNFQPHLFQQENHQLEDSKVFDTNYFLG